MHFARWLVQAVSAASLVAAAASKEEKPAVNAEPDIQASANFAEANAFGHIFNGERNWMSVHLENKSTLNVSVTTVSGSFQNVDTGAVLKNTTSLPYPLALGSGSKITIPYAFHSELKPNDVRLKIWVDYGVDGKNYRAHAYDSIVKVVEPAGSFFDFQMLTTYLMVAAILGGGAYAAYSTFAPQPKKKKTRVPPISSPVEVTATGAGGYQEEWIPAHHIKKKAGETGAAASGTESGTDSTVQRRKSKGKRAVCLWSWPKDGLVGWQASGQRGYYTARKLRLVQRAPAAALPLAMYPHRHSLGHSVMAATPSTRKRKRAGLSSASVTYTETTELDANGRVREVLVIEDTPPPPVLAPVLHAAYYPIATAANGATSLVPGPHIRTRAQAAAAAASAASSSSSSGSLAAQQPPLKKRRREVDDPAPPTLYPRKQIAHASSTLKAWPSASAATEAASPSNSSQAAPPSCDDKEGHYIVTEDDLISSSKRYKTVRLLGQGTFGKVIEALDLVTNKRVAIKIIRAIPKYREASTIEIRVLKLLKERDPYNRHKCIHLLATFDHMNHVCIVSELLGMCIYDFLKENDFSPFPRHQIQSFARQLLNSVAFLHDLQLVHTDLKPENILLVDNSYKSITLPSPPTQPGKRPAPARTKRLLLSTDIRLIDFGSATFEKEYHSTVVSTRHYRAPEIILGLGWSYPCDAFSLGCILVEFYTGVALFQTHENLEHLAMMEMVMGRMPERFARAGMRSKPEFFKEGARLDFPKPRQTKQSKKDVKSTRSLAEIIPPTDAINREFYDLVRKLLMFDPAHRITVREALSHPYFNIHIPGEI